MINTVNVLQKFDSTLWYLSICSLDLATLFIRPLDVYYQNLQMRLIALRSFLCLLGETTPTTLGSRHRSRLWSRMPSSLCGWNNGSKSMFLEPAAWWQLCACRRRNSTTYAIRQPNSKRLTMSDHRGSVRSLCPLPKTLTSAPKVFSHSHE